MGWESPSSEKSAKTIAAFQVKCRRAHANAPLGSETTRAIGAVHFRQGTKTGPVPPEVGLSHAGPITWSGAKHEHCALYMRPRSVGVKPNRNGTPLRARALLSGQPLIANGRRNAHVSSVDFWFRLAFGKPPSVFRKRPES